MKTSKLAMIVFGTIVLIELIGIVLIICLIKPS